MHDVSALHLNPDRPLGLRSFMLNLRLAPGLYHHKLVRRIWSPLTRIGMTFMEIVREQGIDYSPISVAKPDRPVLIVGYWQSNKYFHDAEEIIRRDFEFKTPHETTNPELSRALQHPNSVAVHVRRGDYVSNPQAAVVHGTCGIDYYIEAAHLLRQRCPNAVFFVFSDDLPWARANLRFLEPCHFVMGDTREPARDLHLMTMAQNFIIANSSFSWWGAWLGRAPNKVVIAPRRWFANGRDTPDLIPNDWIRL